MKTKSVSIFIAICITFGAISCRKTGTEAMNQADRNLLERMAFANNAEIDEGNIALKRAEDPSVKSYAQEMLPAHKTAMDELQSLAKQRNYKLPSTPDLEHIALIAKLNNTSGREFDSIYIKTQVSDHLQIIGLLQDEISDGNDEGLKNYAAKYLPIAWDHKKMADEVVAAQHFYE